MTKKMTWKQLKSKIAKLSDDQLKGEVCHQDDYDNLVGLQFYLNDDKPPERIENEDWGTRVEVGHPYFG